VDWVKARPFLGLDICLIALPFAAFMVGAVAVCRSWRADAALRQAALQTLSVARAHVSAIIVAGATITAGGILAIVAMHMITE
jgi:anti-sigma factor RsiW